MGKNSSHPWGRPARPSTWAPHPGQTWGVSRGFSLWEPSIASLDPDRASPSALAHWWQQTVRCPSKGFRQQGGASPVDGACVIQARM